MKKALKIVGPLFALGISLACFSSHPIVDPEPVPPQDVPSPNGVVSPTVTRDGNLITNSDGWPIPDISSLKTVSRRSKLRSEQAKANVYVTVYDPGGIEMPRMDLDGTKNSARKVRVEKLSVYDLDTRPFCYRMLYWDVPSQGAAGLTVVIFHTYYDLDGDGKFETWDLADKGSIQPLIIPNRN
ncbi:MAG: hypothetical protein ABI878_08645 [Acidobacteriota bacterium]